MRFHRLDLNLLVVLDALLSNRSVRKTARLLNLTQPAISNALAKLRHHFNDELFVLIDRAMVPTPFARRLSTQVRLAIDDLGRIATARASFDPETSEHTYVVVCSDYIFSVFMADAVRRLRAVAPAVRIRCILTNEWTVALLPQGKGDLLIAPVERLLDDAPSAVLFEDEFACVVCQRNGRVGDRLDLATYLELDHVSVAFDAVQATRLEQQILRSTASQRRVVANAPTFCTVPELVIGTEMIATVHARSAALFAERLAVRILPPPVDFGRLAIGVQWLENRASDATVTWLRDFLVDHAARLPALALGTPG